MQNRIQTKRFSTASQAWQSGFEAGISPVLHRTHRTQFALSFRCSWHCSAQQPLQGQQRISFLCHWIFVSALCPSARPCRSPRCELPGSTHVDHLKSPQMCSPPHKDNLLSMIRTSQHCHSPRAKYRMSLLKTLIQISVAKCQPHYYKNSLGLI